MQTNWLLKAYPWVEYRTRIDLLGEPASSHQVISARADMLAHPAIQQLIGELSAWPGRILKSHKDAGHLLHKLAFAADLGLTAEDPGMDRVVERVLSTFSLEGIPQVIVNISPAYGGSGTNQPAWMLCDAPLVLYALEKFGLQEDKWVIAGLQSLSALIRDNGWSCAVSAQLRFHGPGRKSDPCPYATLLMLKALSLKKDYGGEASRVGVETILSLWETRQSRKPYLFAMGSDFKKLKQPLIWYDILHVVDVLSHFRWAFQDPRLLEMAEIIRSKAGPDWEFTPESIWMAWKDWDFGQKRRPSPWLTLVARRALHRLGMEA